MKCRYKFVLNHDGSVGIVLQYKWLGIFWRDLSHMSSQLHKAQWNVVDAYHRLHDCLREVKRVEDKVERAKKEVEQSALGGYNRHGPEFHESSTPSALRQRFVPSPGKDYKSVVKAIEDGSYADPDDLGIEWPPPDRVSEDLKLTRTAFVLERHYPSALASFQQVFGERYDHVVKFFKPRQDQNSGRKSKGGNQNQNNQRNN